MNFVNGPPGTVLSDFANGKTAMIFGGPYNLPEILAGRSFKNDPDNLGIAAIPRPCGQTGIERRTVICSVCSHNVIHRSLQVHRIHELDAQPSANAKANQTLPTRVSAYQNNAVKSKQFISEFCSIASTAVARPVIPQSGHLFDAFDPNIAAALDGVESPTAALQAVAEPGNHCCLVREPHSVL